jgi:hypothetical protein
MARYGADADEPHAPRAPRPAYGHRQDGRHDLKPVRLRLGVRGDGGWPRRLGVREGKTSDRVETPLAIAEDRSLGLEGVQGLVAESTAARRRPWGLCLEQGRGWVPLVPRPCAVRQALEQWGPQPPALPLVGETPGRTKDDMGRQGQGQSVVRQVEVESSDGRGASEALRFVGGHSSHLAQPQAQSSAAAQAQAPDAGADHVRQGHARWCAGQPDAEAAIAEDEGRGQGRRGRRPRPWR